MKTIMSWDEWAARDATDLAELVNKGEATPAELASQAAAAAARINPQLCSVVEVFDDVVIDPTKDGAQFDGPFKGGAYFNERFRAGNKRAFTRARLEVYAGESIA